MGRVCTDAGLFTAPRAAPWAESVARAPGPWSRCRGSEGNLGYLLTKMALKCRRNSSGQHRGPSSVSEVEAEWASGAEGAGPWGDVGGRPVFCL